jgi:hypothetical protein
MSYPALIFWLLIVWSFTASRETVLVLLLASMPFASLALLPTGSIGMSILPQSMFAVVLNLKVLVPQFLPLSPKLLTALQLRNLGCLALFLLVGIVATVIMPKLFVGDVVVIPMKQLNGPDLLSTTLQNFTQFGYVTLSVATVFAVTLMADGPSFMKTLQLGVLAGSIVCITTGLIDLAAASAGMESLLQPFRTADYAYLTEVAVAGQKRVVGFTPEASAYGPICVDFAAAILLPRSLFAEGRQQALAATVGVGLLVMAVLSTSSAAYLGLSVLGLAYAFNWTRRTLSPHVDQGGLLWELLIGLGIIAGVLFVLITRADLFDPLLNLVDELIFKKPLTSSYYERSLWNTTAWESVYRTWGLGIGLGSTRTSSWFAAIVSSTGLIGAAFMAIFLLQTFAKGSIRRIARSSELLTGLKLSLLPALAMLAVDSPGPDFGLWIAVIFGGITGIATFAPERRLVSHAAIERPMETHAATMKTAEYGNPKPTYRTWPRDNGRKKPFAWPSRPNY